MISIMPHYRTNFWKLSFISLLCAGVVGCKKPTPTLVTDIAGCTVPDQYVFETIKGDRDYQPWQVRTTTRGITWNGIEVTEQELTEFARQLAEKPKKAGSVTFEVMGISCEQRTKVRKALSRSGLCDKRRCWESNEVVKVPVVYSQ